MARDRHGDDTERRHSERTFIAMAAVAPQQTHNAHHMRHLVVLANPSARSFDHAIVDAYSEVIRAAGQDVAVRDLYALNFDPVLKASERPVEGEWLPSADVAAELEYVSAADVLVLVYPIWFGLPPAILKGYVDRVLGANYSFRAFSNRAGQPPLVGKRLLSFTTSGTPFSWLDEQGQVLSLREIFDVYLWRGFGMEQSEHLMIDSVVPNISASYANDQLDRVRKTARRTAAALAGALFDTVSE